MGAGHKETVEVLVKEFRADVNTADNDGRTAVMFADHNETVEVLLGTRRRWRCWSRSRSSSAVHLVHLLSCVELETVKVSDPIVCLSHLPLTSLPLPSP